MIKDDDDKNKDAQEKLFQQYPFMRDVMNDPTLTLHQKRLKALPVLKELRAQGAKKVREASELQTKVDFLKTAVAAKDILDRWLASTPKIEKNECSRLHMLVDEVKLHQKHLPSVLKNDDSLKIIESYRGKPWNEVIPFVIQHDWAAAFAKAGDYDSGMFFLPYPKCAFEFKISGYYVIAVAEQTEEEGEIEYTFFTRCGEFWNPGTETDNAQSKFIVAQVKAICVALEAQVAKHDPTRVPEKLNRRRLQEGRVPLYAYHIVTLNRASRAVGATPSTHLQTKRRLHFRRGHWRHYAESKTWIKWMLVGDPELGFIEKEYRL